MSRLLFVKEGVAVWSSHLDLMRALMRSFRRAGIDLKHSQGFTPHPELSILMPLSVGVESQCEIAEFTLAEGCDVPVLEIAARMNPVLPAGIQALESYESGQKAGKLAWLRARLTLKYDESPVTGHQSPGIVGGVALDASPTSERPSVGAAEPSPACRGEEPASRPAEGWCLQTAEVSAAAHTGAPRDEMQNAECKMQNGASGTRHQAYIRDSSRSGDEGCEDIAPAASGGDAETSGDASLRRVEAIRALFARPSLIVEKHSKKGDVEMDIAPMIREIHVGAAIGRQPEAKADGTQIEASGIRHQASVDESCGLPRQCAHRRAMTADTVVIEAVVAAQNPTLNPLLLVTAIEKYLPEHKPEHVLCRRLEIYDGDMKVFR